MTCTEPIAIEAPYEVQGSPEPFFRALAALILLDILVLFWLLNPLAHIGRREATALPMTPAEIRLSVQSDTSAAGRPSPLGAHVRRQVALARVTATAE